MEDGVTGFVVESEEDAVAAIKRIHRLDRHRIRQRFEDRFTARRMAQDCVRSYRILMSAAQARQRPRRGRGPGRTSTFEGTGRTTSFAMGRISRSCHAAEAWRA